MREILFFPSVTCLTFTAIPCHASLKADHAPLTHPAQRTIIMSVEPTTSHQQDLSKYFQMAHFSAAYLWSMLESKARCWHVTTLIQPPSIMPEKWSGRLNWGEPPPFSLHYVIFGKLMENKCLNSEWALCSFPPNFLVDEISLNK